jgi:hypothetical protein
MEAYKGSVKVKNTEKGWDEVELTFPVLTMA